MDNFIGEIRPVGFNFAPQGWAMCAGQLLPIEQNDTLFTLIGTTFGGDGETTFALPDLRGRAIEGAHTTGAPPGLEIGSTDGVETVTLTATQVPAHTHSALVSTAAATSFSPVSNVPAKAARTVFGAAGAETLAADTVQTAGGGAPHNNLQPYLCVNYIIALVGFFPNQ
jgi:microcystin-dependent protein